MKLKRIFLFILTLFILHVFSFGQSGDNPKIDNKTKKHFDKGKEYFGKKEFDKAKREFEFCIEKNQDFAEPYTYLASIAYENRNYEDAIANYNKVLELDPNYNPFIYYSLGINYEKVGKLKNALDAYETFKSKTNGNHEKIKKVREKIPQLEFKIKMMEKPLDFNPKRLDSIDTYESEYIPVITGDNKEMIFTRRVNGQEDLFHSYFKDSVWKTPEPIQELNSSGNEGTESITADGSTMIFTRCEPRKSLGGCDLYITERKNGKWSLPKNLGNKINTEFWESQPSISYDGRTLYFVSDRPGCIGGKDIWMSKKDVSGNWSFPECLDTVINTNGDDFAPYIHPDNSTLYFTSNGQIGMGGSDIFKVSWSGNNWNQRKNLGFPINTENDEGGIFITLDGKKGYFSSDRQKSDVRNMDIFEFDVPQTIKPLKMTYVAGKIFDLHKKQALNSDVKIYNNTDNSMLADFKTIDGTFLIPLGLNIDYNITFQSSGYIFHSEHFIINAIHESDDPCILNIGLIAMKNKPEDEIKNSPVILNNIFFAFNSYELDTLKSMIELNNLYDFMKKNDNTHIQITGHTDNIGEDAFNQNFSELRAKAVYDFLVKKGIDRTKMRYNGLGESHPIESNETEAGRSRNRRVEFYITN